MLEPKEAVAVQETATFRVVSPAGEQFSASDFFSLAACIEGLGAATVEGPDTALRIKTEPAESTLEGIIARCLRDVQRYPDSLRPRITLGLALLNANRLSDASMQLQAALKLDPRSYLALTSLARVYLLNGEPDAAEELATVLSDIHPRNAMPDVIRALVAFKRGELSRACDHWKYVVSTHPDAPGFRFNFALTLLRMARYPEAISQLKKAVRINVRSAAFHQTLGIAYSLRGEMSRAARSFRTALNLSPNMEEAIQGLAGVLLGEKEFDAVVHLLRSHLERRPNDFGSRELFANALFQSGNYRAARQELARIITDIPKDGPEVREHQGRLNNNFGVCYWRLGDRDRAIRSFEASRTARPRSDPAAYENLARLHLEVGDSAKALSILTDCARFFPQHDDTQYLRAVCLERQGQQQAAVSVLENIIERGNPSASVYAFLGFLLADTPQLRQRARQVLEDGSERFPTDDTIRNNLAYVCLRQGNVATARQVLESGSMQLQGEIAVYLAATWGLLHLLEGDIDLAEHGYQRAAHIAKQIHQPALAARAMLKMHLEFARVHY